MIEIQTTGDAYARGRAHATSGAGAQVRAATVGRVEQARAEGLFDAAAADYIAAQRAFHEAFDPEGLAELAGIAAGFELNEADLFDHLHLGTLRDLKGGGHLDDGCSAWAVADGPEGPLVVKNRDYSGTHLGIQCVLRYAGPDVTTGCMLTLGSLGSPAAYSSGINASGLAVADTQVSVQHHRIGWLRYFLLPRLLARCHTVTEALDLIARAPHAGGGTLVLADASGATAAVELGAAGPQVQRGGTVWRTNHYVTPDLAADTLRPQEGAIASNSQDRFAYLARTLPNREWTSAAAQALMASHRNDATASAPLCQHGEADAAQTISSVVYSCKVGEMTVCEGNACSGQWQRPDLCR